MFYNTKTKIDRRDLIVKGATLNIFKKLKIKKVPSPYL